jgi:hypothetical protein
MAVHIFRRDATYCWRRRTPRALAIFTGRPHLFMCLRTTSPAMARRLAAQLDATLEDAAMLAENANAPLSSGQVDAMLRAVVGRHLTKLERIAFAAKSAPGFDVHQARSDDKRALGTYTLLDAHLRSCQCARRKVVFRDRTGEASRERQEGGCKGCAT